MTKKLILILSAISLIALLSACSGGEQEMAPNDSETNGDGETNSDAETNGNDEVNNFISSNSRTFPNGVTITTVQESVNGETVKYLRASGLANPATEERLNQELYAFSIWGVGIQYETEMVTEVLDIKYAIIGSYISVRRDEMVLWEGADYPTRYLRTQTFDFTTGEPAGYLSDFIMLGKGLLDFIEAGAFVQVFPGEMAVGNERLIAEILRKHGNWPTDEYFNSAEYYDSNFYLTDTGLGLWIDGEVEGDKCYWAFEADYLDIGYILSQELRDAVYSEQD